MPNNLQEPSRNGSRLSFFKSLPRPQRTAFVLLSVLSLGVLVFWILQFNAHINRPFKPSDNNIYGLDELQVAISDADLDGDGLTDYEERTLYNTSQYLDDSDSDGQTDREEIEKGTDPNCAPGASCDTSTVPASRATTSESLQIEPNIDSGDEGNLQAMMSGNADAATLRALLLDSGVSADVLNSLSDEALIASYQEMLASQAPATTTE